MGLIFGLPATSSADDARPLPDCEMVGFEDIHFTHPKCALNWVENGTAFRLLYTPDADPDALVWQISGGASQIIRMPYGDYEALHQAPPKLIDLDQDGWSDLWFFTGSDNANMSFGQFRYVPEFGEFHYIGQVTGTAWYWDKSGFLVSDRQSGCCGRDLAFSSLEDRRRTWFVINVPAASTGQKCEFIHVAHGEQYRHHPKGIKDDLLFEGYCTHFATDPAGDALGRAKRLLERSGEPVRVSDDTVFYCQLSDQVHQVSITLRDDLFTYRYGKIDNTPDLEFQRKANTVAVLPDNGAGPSRFGHLKFENEGYLYTAYYSYELPDLSDEAGIAQSIDNTFVRGLTARDGGTGATVFEQECLPDPSYDRIMHLNLSDPVRQ